MWTNLYTIFLINSWFKQNSSEKPQHQCEKIWNKLKEDIVNKTPWDYFPNRVVISEMSCQLLFQISITFKFRWLTCNFNFEFVEEFGSVSGHFCEGAVTDPSIKISTRYS